jgi:hypothetical protein
VSPARLALALALLGTLTAHAHAQSPSRSPLAALLPRDDERVHAREQELAERITPLLAQLAGVHGARITIDLPDAAREPLDRPLPAARASVLLTLDGMAPGEDAIRKLVQGAASELGAAIVTTTHTRVPPAKATVEPLVSVGPFRVTARSAPGLRAVLAVSLLANVTLATFLLARLRRRSRVRAAY